WTGGTMRLYLERVSEAYGPLVVRDLGLIASEGRMSLPLDDGGAGVLDHWSNVYEFIPEAEADGAAPPTLWVPEVEVGGRYFLVLTNRAGLYRYQIQDCVEVVGRYGATPLIVFLHKGRSTSSVTGEKLTEHQVLSAAEEVFTPPNPHVARFTVCPAWADPPYYVLCLEEGEGNGSESTWRERVAAFDRALERLNVEYASKRSSGRLGALALRWLSPGTFAQLEAERVAAAGGRAEQVKHPYLVADLDFLARMEPPLGVAKRSGADS
ncbi:MAG: GH3 auxin-responsive promoter family protein, partial [Nitrospinota bacterium]